MFYLHDFVVLYTFLVKYDENKHKENYMPVSQKFKKRIKELVKDTEYKMSALPKEIGINHATLSHALNYGIIPSPRTLMLIADYFNKPFEYILGKTNDENFQKSEENQDFYTRMDLLLKNSDIKFYSFAINHIGIDQSSLNIWKRKKLLPSLEILLSIANYFKCSIDYILGRSDEINCYNQDDKFDIDFESTDE